MSLKTFLCLAAAGIVSTIFAFSAPDTWADDAAGTLSLQTRSRLAEPNEGGPLQINYKTVQWDPAKTAIIVCDMWNQHWCRGATGRVTEMAPRMNRFLGEARRRGVLIVHAPSSCMAYYKDHPARKLAQQVPKAADLPDFLGSWSRANLPSEQGAAWPVDQSDGGCDCEPKCPGGNPWTHQIDAIEIADGDAISDSGIEIGSLFEERGIENVMLVGVHTNMCVIGRPFGLRNMVRWGKNVVLVRDLTDTMYNSRMAPKVPHVRGTELVIEYIEQYVCPTITSSSLLGGPAFRFQQDHRPHVSFIVSDDHYHADKTLPVFAHYLRDQCGCYCTVIHGEGTSNFPTMDELETTDAAVLFIRRLALPKKQLDKFKAYLASGKPLVGMRTASHAFTLRGGTAEAGHVQWPEFDADVLGGNYHDHGPNDAGSDAAPAEGIADHPIFQGVEPLRWHSVGSQYFNAPLEDDATLLMTATVGDRVEPLVWTRKYGDARIVYIGLGHWDDFREPPFRKLLTNTLFWVMEKPAP